MSAAVNIHLEVGSWKFEVRRKRLGEDYAFGGAGFLDGVVMGPPLLPGLRVVAEGFAGDETKSAADPAARVGIQGIVIEKIQEIGNGGEALFVGEHAGFSDAHGGALAHARRRIMREAVEQRIDGAIGAEHGQAFDGPETRLLVPSRSGVSARWDARWDLCESISRGARRFWAISSNCWRRGRPRWPRRARADRWISWR